MAVGSSYFCKKFGEGPSEVGCAPIVAGGTYARIAELNTVIAVSSRELRAAVVVWPSGALASWHGARTSLALLCDERACRDDINVWSFQTPK